MLLQALEAAAEAAADVEAAKCDLARLPKVERELSKARAALKSSKARCQVIKQGELAHEQHEAVCAVSAATNVG